jgi:hypothetical protein
MQLTVMLTTPPVTLWPITPRHFSVSIAMSEKGKGHLLLVTIKFIVEFEGWGKGRNEMKKKTQTHTAYEHGCILILFK